MFKKLKYGLVLFYLYYFVPFSYCDKALEPYINEVVTLTKEHCREDQYNHPIHQFVYFKKLKDNAVGECIIKFRTYKILVDKKAWNEYSEDERWQIVYHEMAHCQLYKDHVDNFHNYMYYSIVPLGKEVVRNQFIEDLRRKCGR